MTWKTWGSGRVDVPPGEGHGYSFTFCEVSPGLHVHETEVNRGRFRFCLSANLPAIGGSGSNRGRDIVEFDYNDPVHSLPPKLLAGLIEEVAMRTAQYTAAHVLSNLAAVIANYPISQQARDQIITAVVMALPNFDDSEACKSPVGKYLVRTREDFIHASMHARFRYQVSPTDLFKSYNETERNST